MFALDVCLSDIEPGEVLELSSANAGLAHELPAWCRGTGHELVATEPDGDRRPVPDPPGRHGGADVQGPPGLGDPRADADRRRGSTRRTG